MKNKVSLNIITSLVAVLFILSLFSGVVVAQATGEQLEKDKEQYRKLKQNYDNTRKDFEHAKGLFEKANQRFRNAKDNKSREELMLNAREYIERAIDHSISHLEVLKSRAELPENKGVLPFDASANIDAHITRLEQLRTKVEQAKTPQDLRDAHEELKDLWIKIRLETRYYFWIIVDHKIDAFITKAENVSTRMDAAIQKLKDEGKDTSKLEEEAAKYNNLLNEAKDMQQQADDLMANHDGFSSDGKVMDNKAAYEFLNQVTDLQKDIIKKLKAVSRQVLEFVKDFRKLSKGKVKIEGSKTETLSGEV